jgi:hypothetical protein
VGLPNYASDLAGRVMVDLMNEPDSQQQGWQPKVNEPLAAAHLNVPCALSH